MSEKHGLFPIIPFKKIDEIEIANNKTWVWVKIYLFFGFIFALIIPDNIYSLCPYVYAYVDKMSSYVGFLKWLDHVSSIPVITQTWYAFMIPLSLPIYIRYFSLYPFRFLPNLARERIGFIKLLLIFMIGFGLSWMHYKALISAEYAPQISYNSGHARSIIAIIMEYRIGLAVLGTFLIFMQIFLYAGTILLFTAIFAIFLDGDELP